MQTNLPSSENRLGLHYFPDTLHYRQSDLKLWLPWLRSMGVAWLTLLAPSDRAIPEEFLLPLIEAGIEPILHFPFSLSQSPNVENLMPLFTCYARWGLRFIILFDRPNSRQVWSVTTWLQKNIVNRFLDQYLPLAEQLIDVGLTPVFPPLEPGGDYWDIAFLRVALAYILQYQNKDVLEKLVLSAYAGSAGRPLDWGMGGPERWPGARPYFTPSEEQDQIGLFIFDWYRAVSQAILGRVLPMILLGVGSPGISPILEPQVESEEHQRRNVALTRYIWGSNEPPLSEPLPPEVIAANFWLLAASANDLYSDRAWFDDQGHISKPGEEVVDFLLQLNRTTSEKQPEREQVQDFPVAVEETSPSEAPFSEIVIPPAFSSANKHPIAHYLLLSKQIPAEADWFMDALRPFIKKYRPTIGFSLQEAALAAQVTVLGGESEFPQQQLETLRVAGCKVVRLSGTGTELACFLSQL